MKDNKPKCSCKCSGVKCGREQSLIKQGKSIANGSEEESICPLQLLFANRSMTKATLK